MYATCTQDKSTFLYMSTCTGQVTLILVQNTAILNCAPCTRIDGGIHLTLLLQNAAIMQLLQMPQSQPEIAHVEPWEAGPEDTRGELVKYGELVILGYNGTLPQGDKGRRRSKFVLFKRSKVGLYEDFFLSPLAWLG